MVASLGLGEEGGRLGRHARAEGQGGLAVLQVGQLIFQGADGRVQAVAGVEVALRPTLDDVEQVGGVLESERGVVVEGGMDSPLRVQLLLAGVHAARR